jgi:hypothetical protein
VQVERAISEQGFDGIAFLRTVSDWTIRNHKREWQEAQEQIEFEDAEPAGNA